MDKRTPRGGRQRTSQQRGPAGSPEDQDWVLTRRPKVSPVVKKPKEDDGDILKEGFMTLWAGLKFFLGGLSRILRSGGNVYNWLRKVNRGNWGPVLIQWLVLAFLGFLVGVYYGWRYF